MEHYHPLREYPYHDDAFSTIMQVGAAGGSAPRCGHAGRVRLTPVPDAWHPC
jgi:hypothetical protein